MARDWFIFAMCLITLSMQEESSNFPSFRFRRYRNTKPEWWTKAAISQGMNVCVSEQVVGHSRRFGRPWTKGQLCGQPTVIKLECCQGYDVMPNEPGCALVKPLDNLASTLAKVGPPSLVDALSESDLVDKLTQGGPFTVFAPVGKAFEKLIALNTSSISFILLHHVIEGRIGEADFEDNLVLNTLLGHQQIRINKFRNGLLTVNCVPMVQIDRETTNGFIHTIESFIVPTAQNTITDILVREPHLSRLATVLVKARLGPWLRGVGPFTLLAPTDEAFDAIPREDYEAIFANSDVLDSILQLHVLEGIWCSSSLVIESHVSPILRGGSLEVTCNGSAVTVGGARIIRADVAATNGFVHLIDKVLLPNEAKSLASLSKELGLFETIQLAKLAGLENMFVNGAKFTVFAPTDAAIRALPNETLQEVLNDPASAYNLLMGHMVTGEYLSRHFFDKQSLPTLAQMRPLQVTIFPKKMLVDGATIVNANNVGRNGVIHVIDRVIIPPTKTVGDLLMGDPQMSVFVNTLNHTTNGLLEDFMSGKGPYTVFAPDNDAFARLPFFTIERMLMDAFIVTSVMTNHVLDGQIFTGALLPKAYYRYNTRHGHWLRIREDSGSVTAGIAVITKKDLLCTNGVVHIVDRVIQLD